MSSNYGSYLQTIKKSEVNRKKKVKDIDFNVVAGEFQGGFKITDLQLQEGSIKTLHSPHTKELLKHRKFNIDETYYLTDKYAGVSNGVKIGVQPRVLNDLSERMFNVVGRGHEVVSVANVYNDDYAEVFSSSNIDIELNPKNDYDLLRISTNEGAYIERRAYEEEERKNNPLNTRYTREFYFPKGKSGDVLKLTGSEFKATINGVEMDIEKGLIVPNTKIFNSQRFMISPSGTFRLRIEFYKLVNGEYKDVGIGFNGLFKLKHTKGGSKF